MEPKKKNKNIVMAGAVVVSLLAGGVAGYFVHDATNHLSPNNSAETALSSNPSAASDGVTLDNAKLVRTKDIIDNASAAKSTATFVNAVKTAGLAETFKAEGSFTVFVPSNAAFEKLSQSEQDALVKPENAEKLKSMLNYHVVSGTYTSASLRVMAQKGESFTTLQGAVLTPVNEDGVVKMKDAKGEVVGISTADIISSNGVIHLVDGVLSAQ